MCHFADVTNVRWKRPKRLEWLAVTGEVLANLTGTFGSSNVQEIADTADRDSIASDDLFHMTHGNHTSICYHGSPHGIWIDRDSLFQNDISSSRVVNFFRRDEKLLVQPRGSTGSNHRKGDKQPHVSKHAKHGINGFAVYLPFCLVQQDDPTISCVTLKASRTNRAGSRSLTSI